MSLYRFALAVEKLGLVLTRSEIHGHGLVWKLLDLGLDLVGSSPYPTIFCVVK
jgi:hypothetical protein